ncbi:hypothetical protein EJO69_05930 [Flaviflexus salsibiostraticola]|uniref:DUF8094 domain-containing protein n=1 Tax=Flaviflexus salsibiostraticola TaxID=1282737 RepID=A0A3S8Z8L1_9ACTO|nr:hypothetical protein [Flaviflexus salsibiostraticola]AZN29892.1 hypothetical protein EJO69_05930 [Flaviflexus salsibiostraticola]
MKTNRKFWALAVAGGLVLSACSSSPEELPTPVVESPTASEGETPEGETESGEGETDSGSGQSQRADQVLAGIAEALATAYDERSTATVLDRIGGPAQLTLEAVFANAERLGIEDIEQVSTSDADSTWSSSSDFPRVAMVFTENPETGTNDQLLVLSQSDGRENYRLWGYADLVPAEVDITFATDTEAIDKDGDGTLATSPRQGVEEYAMRLAGTDTSVTYEEDQLTSSLHAQRDSIAESLGDTGEVSIAARALNHGPLSMATEDGGAVTMGAFEYDIAIARTEPGSTVSVGDELARWMTGEADSTYDVEGTLTSTYQVTVAFYIPAKGEGNVRVIATSSPELINVVDDGSTNPDS